MSESEKQESFLAQLNEVVTEVSGHHQVVLHTDAITPLFEPVATFVEVEPVTEAVPVAAPSSSNVNDANGNSETHGHDAEKEAIPSSTSHAVTGNVKIQLMEISVDEFKSNVEYIQRQFPTLPRRLICDSFSKANFDCRAAMELLTKEQEKKDQSIVPPLLLAARQQQAQQQQQQAQKPIQSAQKSPKAASALQPSSETPPTSRQQPSSSPADGSVKLPLPRGARRSHAGRSPKEDLCYRRVASADKEAERALRQKLKSNVRSRVFNHGVKIGQGRETAANVVERRRGRTSGGDADSSVGNASIDENDDSQGLSAAAAAAVPLASVDVDAEPEVPPPPPPPLPEDASEPLSALRILRDSFPGLPEVRIAECLAECDQDVDAAIRALSGRKFESDGSPDAARFFKSKQLAGKVQQARKDYVRAELSSGAWMSRQTAVAAAANAAAGAIKSSLSVTTLRVYTVPQKRRLTETDRDPK